MKDSAPLTDSMWELLQKPIDESASGVKINWEMVKRMFNLMERLKKEDAFEETSK